MSVVPPPDKSSPEFFEAKYQQKADPWDFAQSEYELGKYRNTVEALEGKRFRRAFEPGCSVGVLTEMLAPQCEALEACDFSQTAVAEAQKRCAHLPQVTITCSSLADAPGSSRFDLLMLSEIGYYFEADGWESVLNRILEPLAPGSTVLATHWLGFSEEHRMSGDEVHRILRAQPQLQLVFEERHEGYRLDRFVRV